MAGDNVVSDAERGVADNVFTVDLPPPPPPTSEGPTRVNSAIDLKQTDPPSLSVEEKEKALALASEKKPDPPASKEKAPKKAAPPKFKFKRASHWVRFKLWYNTYRLVKPISHCKQPKLSFE